MAKYRIYVFVFNHQGTVFPCSYLTKKIISAIKKQFIKLEIRFYYLNYAHVPKIEVLWVYKTIPVVRTY